MRTDPVTDTKRTAAGGIGFFRRNRAVLVIALVALLVRLAFLLAVRPWDPQVLNNIVLHGDAIGYHDLALGILHSGSFESFGAFRTPGYPGFLSAVYAVFGENPVPALFIQIIISSLTTVLVFFWARLAVGQRAAIVAGSLYALEPRSVFNAVTLRSDTLFVVLFLASILLLVVGLKRGRTRAFLFSGLLLGACTLVRPVAQLFPVAVLVLTLFYAGTRWRFRWTAAAVFLLSFLVVLAPWLYRNHVQYDHIALSSIGGLNLLYWGATSTAVAVTGKSVDEVREGFDEIVRERGVVKGVTNPFVRSSVCREIAVEYIRSHPAAYARQHAKGIINMFLNVGSKPIADFLGLESRELPFQHFAAPDRAAVFRAFFTHKTPHEIAIALFIGGWNLLMYLAAALGAFVALRERRYTCLIVFLLVLLYMMAVVGPDGQPRYKLPVIPFYIALSGLGFLTAAGFVRRRVLRLAPVSGRGARARSRPLDSPGETP